MLVDESTPEWLFQREVERYALEHGWRFHHVLPSKRRGMLATQQTGHNGFPDLVLIRGGRCVVAELKAQKGTVSAEQKEWLEAFRECGVEVFLWKPRDVAMIREVLA